MKYCKPCKLVAKPADEKCSRCGGVLSTLGGGRDSADAAGTGAPTGPALSLQGQIQQLQEVQRRTVVQKRVLLGVCAAVALMLIGVLYGIYSYRVLSYAVLENVTLRQDPNSDSMIIVSFDVVKPGKVAFGRNSGGRLTEKLDVFSTRGEVELAWAWPSDRQTGVDFHVMYRGGLTRAVEEKHFDITGRTGGVDIVFLMDTTASMDPFIDALRRECHAFAATVRREGYDCRLGLVSFGDVRENEPIHAHEPVDDIQLFQTRVAKLKAEGGGDEPESSVEALRKALSMEFRPGARLCFVHITDASCHGSDRLRQVATELKQREIATYVVSDRDYRNLYGPLCNHGGQFYDIRDAKFEEILQLVAQSIVSQIRYR